MATHRPSSILTRKRAQRSRKNNRIKLLKEARATTNALQRAALYSALSNEERAQLLAEAQEYKEKSRMNDINRTLRSIQKQLDGLRERTGIEFMLFASPGTTDLPMRPVTFVTDGLQGFLEEAMGIDPQDFAGKMEEYAVQGPQEKRDYQPVDAPSDTEDA